ncbi:RICIN domain-containing protein [Plantactinospora sp. WMMB334]|uniref:RICIN domain-containing protein n=1 Tax=Plantactinospora sp. WMMB334 TaxID=3404119 RepID=UPI003B94CEC2
MKLARTAVAFLSGLCLVGAALTSAAPAYAEASPARSETGTVVGPQAESLRIYNNGSGRCLYDSGNASGGTFTGSCTTGNRYWHGVADDFGGRLVNNATGRRLTAGTASVWSASCNGSTAQQWHGVGLGLVQNVATGTCMQGTTAGGGVFMASCNAGNRYQQWGRLS